MAAPRIKYIGCDLQSARRMMQRLLWDSIFRPGYVILRANTQAQAAYPLSRTLFQCFQGWITCSLYDSIVGGRSFSMFRVLVGAAGTREVFFSLFYLNDPNTWRTANHCLGNKQKAFFSLLSELTKRWYRAVLLKWEFFIKMRVAESRPSFNIEESWFSKNVLFLSKNDFLFYYLKL